MVVSLQILYNAIGCRKFIGNPRNIRIDAVTKVAKKNLGVRNWKNSIKEERRRLIKEPKANDCNTIEIL